MKGRGGFDAIVGNPPFLGGKLISRPLGKDYRESLVAHVAGGVKGHADLCTYFFLRASGLLREGGEFGMLATNTIAQGDSREVGLEQLATTGCSIRRAVRSSKWPGTATLEVAQVWVRRGTWNAEFVLDERPVTSITPFLTPPGAVSGKPYRLAVNADKSFQGSVVLGMGFVLEQDEAEALIAQDPRNRDVIFPYLSGEDLNSRPDQSPSRWVINFRDWPLRRGAPGQWRGASDDQCHEWRRAGVVPDDYPDRVAADYSDCLTIIDQKVRPERQRAKAGGQYVLRRPLPQRWWHYADKRPALYATIAEMQRVLVTARVSPTNAIAWLKTGPVFHEKIIVFPMDSAAIFSVLQSSHHWEWARYYTSTLGATTLNYSPSDCFETFPLPEENRDLSNIGTRYHAHRESIMLTRNEGLTSTYNRFNDLNERAADIATLRGFQIDLDQIVAAAYGWTDLNLEHGFHETKQGARFTISEAARREVLARLLILNKERYQEELRLGLHSPKQGRTRQGGEPASRDLLDSPNDDTT
jgi:hypothetical protein